MLLIELARHAKSQGCRFATVFAASPSTQGQPNQSCQAQPFTPGMSASAPGSAFDPNGKAGTVYAGTQLQNSVTPMSIS